MNSFGRLTLFCVVAFFCPLAIGEVPSEYVLRWSDEFLGASLDSDSWTAEEYRRDDAQLTSQAVALRDGLLRISTFSRDGLVYTGFLSSGFKRTFLYGYFESRIRFIGVSGQHCAFWLQSPSYGTGDDDPVRFGVEVDVVEYALLGRAGVNQSNIAFFNAHWNGYGRRHQTAGGHWESDEPLDGAWHVYAVNWTPDEYVFYVDGVRRWSESIAVSGVAQEIRFSCEVKGGTWKGDVPDRGYGDLSVRSPGMEVDWIRVWQRP